MSREALKQALLNLEVDANAIFNYPSNETPQDVRDVINWYAASIRTFTLNEVEPPDHMDALRFADEIDPLTRKANPDNLTLSCAAKVLRNLVQQEEQQSCDRPEQTHGQNPKFTMDEWEAHARKHQWRFDEEPVTGVTTLAQPDHPEQMARLGWQYIECPACGSEGARAFPKPEEDPVAWLQIGVGPLHEGDVIARTRKPKEWNPEWWKFEPLYASPPKRQWVGLTSAECLQIEKDMMKYYDYQHECKTVCLPEFARAIEAKLKEKNKCL
jgi:hypothetical protein